MKTQSGFILPSLANPWVLLGAALVAVALYGWGRYDGSEIEAAKHERLSVAREKAWSRDYARWTKAAQAERDRHAAALKDASEWYQGELRRLEGENATLIADVRAGKRKLSIAARCPGAGQAQGSGVPAAGTSSSGRDAETRAELHDSAAEFLISEAARADKVVAQLTAAQKVIRACEAIGTNHAR